MNKLKVAIVGLGRQNLTDHIPSLLRRKDTEIVGCFDPDDNSILSFKNQYPEVFTRTNIYTSLEEIDYSNLDFAVVAVPHDQYSPIINNLLSHGIYFLKEKPLSRNIDELRLIDDLNLFKKLCFVGTQRRFNPLYIKARSKVEEIGVPYMFNYTYRLNIADPELGWRGDPDKAGGGCILDMGYHVIDQLIWWFGEPDNVNVYKTSLANGEGRSYAEDAATITFNYKTGLHGNISLSRSSGEKIENYSLSGSRGYLSGNKKMLIHKDRSGEVLLEETLASDDVMIDSQLNYFIEKLLLKGSFKENVESNIKNMEFIKRCYE